MMDLQITETIQLTEAIHMEKSVQVLSAAKNPHPGDLSRSAPAAVQEELSIDPAVIKLIEYAKEKKTLSYEELSDYLPEHIANTDKIEQVLALLEKNNVQLIEEESAGEEDSEPETRKTIET
jgi:RNA polymerase primary sigma factor